MGYLSFVREFYEHLIVHRNQFYIKQHLLGKKLFIRTTNAILEKTSLWKVCFEQYNLC